MQYFLLGNFFQFIPLLYYKGGIKDIESREKPVLEKKPICNWLRTLHFFRFLLFHAQLPLSEEIRGPIQKASEGLDPKRNTSKGNGSKRKGALTDKPPI